MRSLSLIANLAKKALSAIENQDEKTLLKLVSEEGKVRESLFPKVVTPLMKEFEKKCLSTDPGFLGLKVCGAGGGDVFFAISLSSTANFSKVAEELGMKVLPFTIEPQMNSKKVRGIHFSGGKSGQYTGVILEYFEKNKRWALTSLFSSEEVESRYREDSLIEWIDSNPADFTVVNVNDSHPICESCDLDCPGEKKLSSRGSCRRQKPDFRNSSKRS